MEKKVADNCKHWLFPSCPRIQHPLMARFKAGLPGVRDLDDDIDEMDQLCGTCSAFSPRIKVAEPARKHSPLFFAPRHVEHGRK